MQMAIPETVLLQEQVGELLEQIKYLDFPKFRCLFHSR